MTTRTNWARGLLAVGAVLAGLAYAQRSAKVHVIRSIAVRDNVVEVAADTKPMFSSFALSKPSRLVVDIFDATFGSATQGNGSKEFAGTSGLERVLIEEFRSPTSTITRLTLFLDEPKEYEFRYASGALTIQPVELRALAIAPKVEPTVAYAAPAVEAEKQAVDAPKVEPEPAPKPSADEARKEAEAAAERLRQEEAKRAETAKEEERRREEAALAKAAQEAKAEEETRERKRLEAEAQAALEKAALQKAEDERVAHEKEDRERAAQEIAAREKSAQEKASQDLAAQKKTEEKLRLEAEAKAQEEAARVAAGERAAADKLAREERERAAEAKREEARLRAEEAKRAAALRRAAATARPEATTRPETPARAETTEVRVALREPVRREVPAVEAGNGRRNDLLGIGFQPRGGTAFITIRTAVPASYEVVESERELVLVLKSTRISIPNNARLLDTSFFDTAVALIRPMVNAAEAAVRVEVRLKRPVGYRLQQVGNELRLEFAPTR